MPDDLARRERLHVRAGLDIPGRGVASTAAIAGHPVHPMLVPLPIGFLVGALLADLAFWATQDVFWARGAFWLIAAGIAGALLAAVFGLIDFATIQRARSRSIGWVHMIGNLTAVGLAIFNLGTRWTDSAAAVLPWGLVISLAIVGMLLVTGWAGGELAYRYKIGVIEEDAQPR